MSPGLAAASSVLSDTVVQRLDTINVLAEALANALRDGDRAKESELGASLDRFVTAFRWNGEACLPAVLSYANARADDDDELFAPAFILAALVPDGPDRQKVMGRLSSEVSCLLARVAEICERLWGVEAPRS